MQAEATFTDPAVQRCPFPLIEKLQKESPVYRDPVTGFLVISRYDDIVYVSQHPELFSNTTTVILDRKHSPVAAEVGARYQARGFLPMHTLVTNDPPSHVLYRALVDRVFTAPFVRGLEPHIKELADSLIDTFAGKGRVDLLVEFATKLPMFLITEQLGLSRDDWQTFKHWSDISIEQINPMVTPERELQITDDLIEMQQYLHRRSQDYLKEPAPTLLSRLAHAEVDGRRLEPRELVAIAHQLLVAGNETTTNAIATAIFLLLEQPELRSKLEADRNAVPAFVEEVLRLHAPSPQLYRQVVQDTEIGGAPVPEGAVLMLSYLAGNHDPSKFENPGCVHLDRANGRQHLAFGRGIHFCIGNQLARAELRIAIDCALTRLPGMRFDPDYPKPEFAPVYHVRGLDQLHVVF